MYEVIEIIEYAMTRDVMLKNLVTGKVEKCFDDSALISDYNNFEFMQVGSCYKCKILLFGNNCIDGGLGESMFCEITKQEVIIGNYCFAEVKVGNDYYYLPRKEVEQYLDKGSFMYSVSRKDLIQVDNIVHPYRVG